jgi:hypothetical protein
VRLEHFLLALRQQLLGLGQVTAALQLTDNPLEGRLVLLFVAALPISGLRRQMEHNAAKEKK